MKAFDLIYQHLHNSFCGEMSKVNSNVTNCKQRFKAVERFLRRVAFNLGNTPSQTEVKILSCIPIDVTDLQQKIFQLQKELEEARNNNCCGIENRNRTSDVHAAICNNICSACDTRRGDILNTDLMCNEGFLKSSSISSHCQGLHRTASQLLSPVSAVVCPSQSSHDLPFTENITNMDKSGKNRNLFSKKKKLYKKKKCKTQLVYCAQTATNTPFRNGFSLPDDVTSKNLLEEKKKSETLSRSYLENMVQKQYKPQPLLKEFSNLSEFSSPICRDNCLQHSPFDFDVCSCCNGQFQNIDKFMNNYNKYNIYSTCETVGHYNSNAYYDSKFYDLVPVKENPLKIRNDFDIQKRKEPTIKCWPEKVRHKHRFPAVVNCCTLSTVQDDKKFSAKLQNRKDIVMDKMAAKPIKFNPRHVGRDDVDFGPVYTKQKENNQKTFLTATKMCNANGSPNSINNADCQTANAPVETPPEDKTETTLNQIKDILQTVLTAVKTSSQLGKSVELPKKDAVVQNGPSQGNLFGASQLLQSYTYSPYNMNPYIASCSHQMSSNNYVYPEYPNMQGRHLQQYPLLIQPQKHMCTNCFRNSHISKSVNTARAASAGTNTEQSQERRKETERLIKEIYKSMALNVEIPSSKDDTVGKYSKPKLSVKKSVNSVKKESDREPKRITNVISEIFRNKNPQDSTMTGDTTLSSNITANQMETGFERPVHKDIFTKRMYSQKHNSTTETIDGETEQMSRDLETEEQSDASVNEVTEESDSETETDDVVVEIKESSKTIETKKEKNGIFKKMLKMFQPRQRRRRREDDLNEAQNESESDSDDYQTVYSQQVAAPKPKKVATVRSRAHSKVFHSKQAQQRRSRTKSPEKSSRGSPYMEQMYRRYWDEKLMFSENQRKPKRYSTDISRDTSHSHSPQRRRPVFYQNYEARSVIVDPIRQVPLRMPGNVLKQQIANKSNYERIYDDYDGNRTKPPRNRPNYIENSQNNQRQRPNNPNYARNYPHCPVSSGHIKPHYVVSKSNGQRKNVMTAKGLAWIKKHKLQCGPQWKELILNG